VYVKEQWDYDANMLRPEVISHSKVEKFGRVHQYPLKDQDNVVDPLQGGLCCVSFDAGPPADAAEVWLLMMAVLNDGERSKKPDSKLVPDAIVLEKIFAQDGLYRRTGVYACEDAMAEWIVDTESPALLGWEQRMIIII
jgi:hypothetical protein